jgi:aryl-alcohol dehydrogenase-like predicted oxidoreductase
MRRRRLGCTDLQISVVGLGAWAIGGGDWRYGLGPQDDEVSIATIHAAVAAGINWVDTAASYGFGHSEEVIGRALRQLPPADRPLVFTKCGVLWREGERDQEPERVLRPDTIRAEATRSLARLGVERIDLYQVHWPPNEETVPLEESWAALAALVDEGLVRAIGVSNFSLDQMRRCHAIRQIDSMQPPLSLIHRGSAEDLIPFAGEIGSGVIIYSPLQTGLLTDRWTLDRVASLPVGDRRRWHEDFISPNLEQNLALRDLLRPVAARHGSSVAAMAVAWALAWPDVTAAIHGARSVAQLDDGLSGAALELDDEDLDVIAAAVERSGAGEGPARPALEERLP